MTVGLLKQGFHILKMPEERSNTDTRPLRYLLGSGHQSAFLLQGQRRIDNRDPTTLTAQSATIDFFCLHCL